MLDARTILAVLRMERAVSAPEATMTAKQVMTLTQARATLRDYPDADLSAFRVIDVSGRELTLEEVAAVAADVLAETFERIGDAERRPRVVRSSGPVFGSTASWSVADLERALRAHGVEKLAVHRSGSIIVTATRADRAPVTAYGPTLEGALEALFEKLDIIPR